MTRDQRLLPQVRLAVVGSRDFPYPWMVSEYLDRKVFDQLVSGGAKGVDSLARAYSIEHDKPFKEFPADWDLHGKIAGFIRNREIVEYATDVVAFHYMASRGTQHTIDLARGSGKLREVICVY